MTFPSNLDALRDSLQKIRKHLVGSSKEDWHYVIYKPPNHASQQKIASGILSWLRQFTPRKKATDEQG